MISKSQSGSGAVIWFTGLSGSGKSTLADALGDHLSTLDYPVERIDGDEVRKLFPATGFTRAERLDHVKRIGFAASLLEKHGVVVLVSLISPHREARDFARRLCGNFVEVYLSTPLVECERRDPKGLYLRARAGELKCFTGVSDQYEIPNSPEVILNTIHESIDESLERLMATLLPRVPGQAFRREEHARIPPI